MVYVTDLLCVIPCSAEVNATIQLFKFNFLDPLFDAIIALQLARE